MALLNQVIMEKPKRLSLPDIIRLQVQVHCFLNKVMVSEADLNCLVYLGTQGQVAMDKFCKEASYQALVFKTPQTVRNALRKFTRMGLILTLGKSKKTIMLNPEIQVVTVGNIFLNLKFIYLEE